MATEVQNHPEPSLTSLVSGIVGDMQDLIKQQLQLTRREIEEDLRKTKEAASLFVMGASVCFLGAILLCLMVVHLIHWLSASAGNDTAFPLWACHGVVGFALVVLGGIVVYMGRQKMKSVNPLDNPATEALKENVQWMTNPK